MVKNLKHLRNQKGISQQKLANEIGISQQSINKYENHNIEPDIDTLIALAEYFETTVDDLLGVKKTVKKQKILYFQFRWQESADVINEYLDNGWTIKEMHTHPLTGGQHPEGVVIIEKTILN